MLSVYLRAAKLVMRKKQERPGVVVHVRLGGDAEKSSKKEGNNEKSKPSVANSFAAWAWTGEYLTTESSSLNNGRPPRLSSCAH